MTMQTLFLKPSLPANDLSSYRLISNLSFISKVLEKVVSCLLNVHLNCNRLSNVFHSAYKQFHFTETALLKVHNDISLNIATTLILLDLSAPFDTIDYSVLLDLASDCYGISGTALTWIHSFSTNSFQSIQIRNRFSKAVPLFCSVSQGSVLVPILFNLYTTPLSSLIHSHKLDHHLCMCR